MKRAPEGELIVWGEDDRPGPRFGDLPTCLRHHDLPHIVTRAHPAQRGSPSDDRLGSGVDADHQVCDLPGSGGSSVGRHTAQCIAD